MSVTATFLAAPAISRLTVSPHTFKAAAHGPSTLTSKPRSKLGTVVSYVLNEVATVRFTVERLLSGATTKQGAHVHCAAPAGRNRKGARCTRIVALRGSFVADANAGKNAFRFTGRLAGKGLARGAYLLLARPTAGGVTGTSVKVAFHVGS
jgi:hypothetical protein